RSPVTEHDGGAQGDTTGSGQLAVEEGRFPRRSDVDRESCAELALGLGHRTIFCMSIDRRGRGVDPQRWRVLARAQRARELPSGVKSGPEYLRAILRVVATVHALAREIDEQVCALEQVGDRRRLAPRHR